MAIYKCYLSEWQREYLSSKIRADIDDIFSKAPDMAGTDLETGARYARLAGFQHQIDVHVVRIEDPENDPDYCG